MPALAEYSNVYNSALLILRKKGYRIWLDAVSDGEWWLCGEPSYEEYVQTPLVLENALISLKGTWGGDRLS